MVGSVVVDAGTLTNTAIAAISTATGSSNTATTSIVAATAAALAATATHGFAEEVLAEIGGKFRKRKVVPSIASSLTSKTANTLALLRGGGATGITKKAPSVNKVVNSNIDNGPVTRGKSVAFMALAMACHYLGKWLVRVPARGSFDTSFR